MTTIKLVDARRGLYERCKELFSNTKIADQIYTYLCDGIEDCDYAEPERKRGKWVYPLSTTKMLCECSECETTYRRSLNPFKFCPNCGADMGEEEQE